jgi:hypothetical protein
MILKGKSIGSNLKKTQKENSWFEEPRCKLEFKARSKSKVQFASNESKLLPWYLDPKPHLKWALMFGECILKSQICEDFIGP